jgi:hypothetical protein
MKPLTREQKTLAQTCPHCGAVGIMDVRVIDTTGEASEPVTFQGTPAPARVIRHERVTGTCGDSWGITYLENGIVGVGWCLWSDDPPRPLDEL